MPEDGVHAGDRSGGLLRVEFGLGLAIFQRNGQQGLHVDGAKCISGLGSRHAVTQVRVIAAVEQPDQKSDDDRSTLQ